jgi:hypothetical protein
MTETRKSNIKKVPEKINSKSLKKMSCENLRASNLEKDES